MYSASHTTSINGTARAETTVIAKQSINASRYVDVLGVGESDRCERGGII